jgi:hypothetical protein
VRPVDGPEPPRADFVQHPVRTECGGARVEQ